MLIRYFHYILIVLVMIYGIKCAARGRPGGGPVDKTPPEIIYTFPSPDSTNVTQLAKIEIHFSERMNEGDVQNSVFISPLLKFESEWTGGDELTLILNDTLLQEKTYVITIGSGSKDEHNNRLKESFQFAFSTGNKIDRGSISGYVYGLNANDVFYIYAYKMTDTLEINPVNQKADFLSQPGPEGSYELDYLSLGKYRVFVVEDQNKNLLLDADFERVGVPTKDAVIDSANMNFTQLNFSITKSDTTAPFVSGVRATNNRTLLLRISEPVQIFPIQNISISDSLGGKILNLIAFTKNNDEPNQFYIFTQKQDSAANYILSIKGLTDTLGNAQTDTSVLNFAASALIDTTHFRLLGITPKDSALNLNLTTQINFNFSFAVDTLTILNNFSCLDSSTESVSGLWHWINLSQGNFVPEDGFQPGEKYTFSIDPRKICSLWGDTLPDSTVISRMFSMVSPDEFGSVSGVFEKMPGQSGRGYISLNAVSRGAKFPFIPINDEDTFIFNWVPEGQYILSGFLDMNYDQKFSAGNVFEFEYAEPFFISPDTVRVRKRWETSNVKFFIPESE